MLLNSSDEVLRIHQFHSRWFVCFLRSNTSNTSNILKLRQIAQGLCEFRYFAQHDLLGWHPMLEQLTWIGCHGTPLRSDVANFAGSLSFSCSSKVPLTATETGSIWIHFCIRWFTLLRRFPAGTFWITITLLCSEAQALRNLWFHVLFTIFASIQSVYTPRFLLISGLSYLVDLK